MSPQVKALHRLDLREKKADSWALCPRPPGGGDLCPGTSVRLFKPERMVFLTRYAESRVTLRKWSPEHLSVTYRHVMSVPRMYLRPLCISCGKNT